MAFITTTEPERAEGAVAGMYDRQRAAWGYLPSYARVFCHRPEVLARWGRLLAEIRRPMDRRRFELVTFAAAHELRNTACCLAHGRALGEYLATADILAVARGEPTAAVSPAEQAMLAFARQVARDATGVSAAQVQGLRDHGFSDPEIFDIAATAAGRAFFAKLLDALGVQADARLAALEADFRESLCVGRPVETQAPETEPRPEAAALSA